MTILDDVAKMDRSSASAVATLIAAIIAPGCMIVFYFYRYLFLSLDAFKLLLLAVAFSAPSFFVQYVVAAITSAKMVQQKLISPGQLGNGRHWYFLSATNSAINLYLGILVCYLFDLTFRTFVIFVLVSTLICAASIMFTGVRSALNPDANVPIDPA